jgi:MYND finger
VAYVVITSVDLIASLSCCHRIGIIKSYCYQDVEYGISLLKMASAQGYVRASYALGLVLRDSQPDEASTYMELAASAKYLPALQELLPAREMKAKYGEPNADQLRRHLDHLCLNRLLSRHYIRSPELRVLNTSHCWNPLCGRWAFKATVNSKCPGTHSIRRPWSFAFMRHQDHLSPVPSDDSRSHDSDESVADISRSTSTSSSSPSEPDSETLDVRVSRMKMCSRCCRAKYCSKLCQVYDWRSGRHKMECQFL